MKPGDVVKVYELDGKWYEEVCVDSHNTVSRPVTQQGIAEATASAERAVYDVLERPQPTPPDHTDPEPEISPEAADEAEDDEEDDPDAPLVPKRGPGRPRKHPKK